MRGENWFELSWWSQGHYKDGFQRQVSFEDGAGFEGKGIIKAWQRHVGEARTLGLSSRSKAVLPIHCLEPSAASEQKCVICQEICGITSGQQQGSDTQIPEEKFSLVGFFFSF